MRRALSALLSVAAITVVSAAHADRSLALPKLLSHETAMPVSVLGVGFFVPHAILDLRGVQEHPVMRARRDYSLMAALPTTSLAGGAAVPILSETATWKLSKSVVMTFPLAITGRNIVTAEIAGAGRIGLAPEGMAKGGVFTFAGAF
jgi:hypothetical protein